MARIYADDVKEWSSTTGSTRPYVLGGAFAGKRRFGAVAADGDEGFFRVTDGVRREVILATYHTATNSLTPTAYYSGTSIVTWPATVRPIVELIEQPLDLAAEIRDFSPANVLHWGHTAYPVDGYGWGGGPNTYIYGDAGDTDSDVSMIARVTGNQRWEWGMVGDITDTVHHQSFHLKEVAGTYPSETFVSRLIAHEPRSPRYPFIDIYAGATAANSYFRVYPGGSNGDAALIIGNATYGFPGRTGEGLTIAWESGSQIARLSSATWNAFYRQLIFEANRMRFLTGPVNLIEAMEFTNKGAVNLGSPIQYAASAQVSNFGQAGLDDMTGYSPGSTITPVGGTGTAPTFTLTETQVSKVNSIPTAGTGGTTSTSTTLSAAAAVGASSITVTSSTGFATSDTVLIHKDDGYFYRGTITVSGLTWTLSPTLDGAAASGSVVYKEQTVQGTTGTGTKATFSVRIASGGIAQVLYIQGGTYTVNPTALTLEPVTGAGLGGAPKLNISMGGKTVTLATAGAWTVTPDLPVATTSSTGGTGLTLDITYSNSLGTLNAAVGIFDNGAAPTGDLASGYVRKNNATLNNPTFVGATFSGVAAELTALTIDNGAGAVGNIIFQDGGSSNKWGISKLATNDFAMFDYRTGVNHYYVNPSTGGLTIGETTVAGVAIGNPTGGVPASGSLSLAGSLYDNGQAPTGTAGTGYVRATAATVSGLTLTGATTLPGTQNQVNASGQVLLGNTSSLIIDGFANSQFALRVGDGGAGPVFGAVQFDNSANSAFMVFAKSRGSAALAGAVQSGDNLASWYFDGDDGSTNGKIGVRAAEYYVQVDGTVSANVVPGRHVWWTMNSAGTRAERMRLTSSGLLTFQGVTSSFPALKRSSTELQVRLADDSLFAPLAASKLTLDNGAGAAATWVMNDGGTTKYTIGKGASNDFSFFDSVHAVNFMYVNTSGGLTIGETTVAGVAIGSPSGGIPASGSLSIAGSLYDNGTAPTGTAGYVRSTSPTLVTPLLGTPTSGNLANCTGYPTSALTGGIATAYGNLKGDGAGAVTAGSHGVDFAVPAAHKDYDFVNGIYWDAPNNVPNAITTTRASTGYVDTAAGVWSSVANDTLRRSDKGALIEEARTNGIRNNSMQGAAAGTPGTLPTNWAFNTLGVLTQQVVGTGTENGVEYIDIRLSGTATGTSTLRFESFTQIAASNGQTWSQSIFVKLAAGSLSNMTFSAQITMRDGAGGNLGTGTGGVVTFVPTATLTRVGVTSTNNNASTAFEGTGLNWNYAGAVDVTLRIGWPQLELGASVSSPIRTTSAAATRATDVVRATSSSGAGTEYTADLLATPSAPTTYGSDQYIATLSDGTSSNRWGLLRLASTGVPQWIINSTKTGIGAAAWAQNASGQLAGANAVSSQVGSFNGAAVTTGSSATSPTGITRIEIGGDGTGAGQFNGYIKRLIIWPNNRLADHLVRGVSNAIPYAHGYVTSLTRGTTVADSAAAGDVGEFKSAGSLATAMTSTVAVNIASISLTAGDWDVEGFVKFNPAGTTTSTLREAGLSQTTGTLPTALEDLTAWARESGAITTGVGSNFATGCARISLATTTTVYLVGKATFATSTMTADGYIKARRVR